MKKLTSAWLQTFFGRQLEFKVRLFHVLAITGVLICIVMTVVSMIGGMYVSAAINFGAGLVSLFLLLYSARKQRYRFCYTTTLAVIFFLLFPSLFFYGGGYLGGMPFFFVFAVVFTVYMLDGWGMVAAASAELVVYSLMCVAAYYFPQTVVPFSTEWEVMLDTVIGFVTVGISLGATMFIQMWMYRRQQRELEQARREAESANRAKSAFLANMSHEIRTPIHMILGMNEIIRRESRSSQVRTYAGKIDETGQMLLSLVDSVLDVSKIESGKMELIPRPYETERLVQAVELIGRTACGSRHLEFSCHAAEDLPPVLVGDLSRIRQIASNFLSNAAKYTENGRVTASVFREPGASDDEVLLCIAVRDTGIGIPKEAIPTLFDSFTRAEEAEHRQIAGTGLGLAIVRELTQLMGGTLAVESEPEIGSTFTVRLPQKLPGELQKTELPTGTDFRAPQARMLVVDDNEGNRLLMQQLLRPTGIRVDTADSGSDCLERVRQQHYDVILMDYMMPSLDGLQTMEQLRRMPDFSTPVIALTADATPQTRQKLLDGGFSAYLTKPIPWEELRRALLHQLPPQLVIRSGTDKLPPQERALSRALESRLDGFGVCLPDAMQYFSGLSEYGAVAELFLGHRTDEEAKVRFAAEAQDWEALRFPVHALKGKARNLGMARLADVCAYVEGLCLSDSGEEIRSLMPYLFFLWGQAAQGMQLLCDALPERQEAPAAAQKSDTPLLTLLRQNRRRPVLQCVDAMLERESDPDVRERLRQIQILVRAVDFDGAIRIWENGTKEQKGGDAG